MSQSRKSAVSVLLAAGLLLAGANIGAYAANGHPLLLGAHNVERKTAGVHNLGPGPALSLRSRAHTPSLAVSTRQKVPRLNADRVDGLEGGGLRTRSWTYRIGGDNDMGPTVVKSFPGLPVGYYLASYDVIAHLYADGYPMSCSFQAGAQSHGVYAQATQTKDLVTVSASGFVDARKPITFTCEADPAFDTSRSDSGGMDSRVTFTRLDTSSFSWAHFDN